MTIAGAELMRHQREGVEFLLQNRAGLVAFEAPISMAALNPARDLGPRILTLLAGWGEIAFPGPRGVDFLIPTVSTIVGGLIGGAIYTYLYKRVYLAPPEIGEEPPEVRGE